MTTFSLSGKNSNRSAAYQSAQSPQAGHKPSNEATVFGNAKKQAGGGEPKIV